MKFKSLRFADPEMVSPSRVFYSQCVDHTLALALGALLFGSALSFLPNVPGQSLWTGLATFGASFWLGMLLTLIMTGLVYRIFFNFVFGATLGNQLFHLRPAKNIEDPTYWADQIFESAHLALPALWALDILARSQRSRFFGIRYVFHY